MKKSTYLWMLPLLFVWPQQMTAQHPLSLPADSITIDSLLETVEKIHPIGFSPLLVLLSRFW